MAEPKQQPWRSGDAETSAVGFGAAGAAGPWAASPAAPPASCPGVSHELRSRVPAQDGGSSSGARRAALPHRTPVLSFHRIVASSRVCRRSPWRPHRREDGAVCRNVPVRNAGLPGTCAEGCRLRRTRRDVEISAEGELEKLGRPGKGERGQAGRAAAR